MRDFVELWVYLSSTPLFGLAATLVAYVIAHEVYTRLHRAPLANPVLWSIVAIAFGLWLFNVPYPTYFSGAQFVHFLLGPAVVALGYPLWQRRAEIVRRGGRFVLASLAGCVASVVTVLLLAWLLDMPRDVIFSLVPKSVTAPVAMGIAQEIGGIPSLAAVFAVLTGLVGAATGRYLFDALRIQRDTEGWMARGYAIGTASHGLGAGHAMLVNADAGAYAGLALSVQIILSSLLIPGAFWLTAVIL